MKEYTAIYNTDALKGIQYSFEEENLDKAIEFCSYKFSQYPNIAIMENTYGESGNEGKLVFLNGYKVGEAAE